MKSYVKEYFNNIKFNPLFTKHVGLIFLLQTALGIFVWSKDTLNLDKYLVVVLPLFLISVITLAMATALSSNQMYVLANLFLMHIGAAMQVMVSKVGMLRFITVESIAFILAIFLTVGIVICQKHLSTNKQILLGLAGFLTCYLILAVIGKSVNETTAWLKLGNVSVQPTEFSRFFTFFTLAAIFGDNTKTDLEKLTISLGIMALNIGALIYLRELGTIMVLVIVYLLLSFIFLDKIRYSMSIMGILGSSGGVVLGTSFVLNKMYANGVINSVTKLGAGVWNKVYNRCRLFLKLESLDPFNEGFQPLTARNCIHLGGWFGSPFSIEVPVEESDMVFPSLMLNGGFMLGILVLILFLVILFEGSKMFPYCNKGNEKVLGAAFVYTSFVQSLLMFFGSTNFFLLIGLPISWLSAGGSYQSLVFTMLLYIIYTTRKKGK